MAKGMELINPNLNLDTPPKSDGFIPVLKAADKLYKMIYEDSLTGFENRRGLNQFKNNLKPEEYPLMILTFDLDNLKEINDNGGHTAGDEYICSFVEFVNEFFPNDNKFRLGGDEFAIPVKNSNPELVQEVLDTISPRLEAFNHQHQNTNKLNFTFAYDIASSDSDFYNALKRSDSKEIEAKKLKKNLGP